MSTLIKKDNGWKCAANTNAPSSLIGKEYSYEFSLVARSGGSGGSWDNTSISIPNLPAGVYIIRTFTPPAATASSCTNIMDIDPFGIRSFTMCNGQFYAESRDLFIYKKTTDESVSINATVRQYSNSGSSWLAGTLRIIFLRIA